MTIPQFMLFSWLGLIVCGLLFYGVVDAYEPEPIPVIFDAKNMEKYPLHKFNFFAKDSGTWHYVLRIPEGLRVYYGSPGYNVYHMVQALGLERSNLSEDWVGDTHSRRYFVDIGDIYEIEFWHGDYTMGAWGYRSVDVKFRKNK